MSSPHAVIVLQARFASRRLPGKAMRLLGGRPILARCLDRLGAGSHLPVVLATTTNREDDELQELATRHGCPVVRGPECDVLHRFVMVAERFGPTWIVRATADNPAVDIDAPARTLDTLIRTGADYVIERGLPYGTCVEAVSVDALTKADALASDPADREHVTPFVRRGRRLFTAVEALAPPDLRRSDLRLTVDTPADLMYMQRVITELGNPTTEPPLREIITAAEALSVNKAVAVR